MNTTDMKIKFYDVYSLKDYLLIVEKYPNIEIDIKNGSYIVDGKSLLGITSMGFNKELSIYFSEKNNSLLEELKKYLIV